MLYVYHSNQLDVLEGILANRLQAEPCDLFSKELVLVQSKGMAQWLKLKLSNSMGVAAQIDFPMPSSFIWKIFNSLYPHLPEQSDFDKEAMILKLYKLLQDKQNQPTYAPIKHYLSADKDGLSLYKLSEKIADLFDQYLVYRPDWLLAWEQGVSVEIGEQQHSLWQQDLWQSLVGFSEELGQSTQHRARLLSELSNTNELLAQQLKQGLLPKRVFVFAISAMPASYWALLQALSEHIEVHFFMLNLCENYWQDLDSYRTQLQRISHKNQGSKNQAGSSEFDEYYDVGNPLLSSWGKMGRDFLSLMHQTQEQEKIQDISAWVKPEETSLLAQVQADILTLTDRSQGQYELAAAEHSQFKTPIDKTDNSLSLVSAHSELREVQHLHDRLWHWFLEDGSLEPKDVLVMTPDINRYAPFVNAVFSSAQQADSKQNRYIPWAISDQSISEQAPLLESLLSLFNLPKSRFSLQEVLDLLNTQAILKAFNLSASEVQTIQQWLDGAGVRWGLDEIQRSTQGVPLFSQNSWLKGVRQLLLGYVSSNTHQGLDEDWAIENLEGQDAEIADGLIAFVMRLQYWYEHLNGERAAQDWVSVIHSLMDDFFAPNEEEALALQFVRDGLEQWQTRLKANEFNEPLSQAVMYEKLASMFNEQGGWQSFLTGKVNVCTLMPMRAIPFKIICLLGMNDSDYPRSDMPVSFDLMRLKPKQGDRSPANDDRYLFLEALSCAQQKLYISYRGREAKKNSEQQPSVLVSELVDYLTGGFCLAEDSLLKHEESQANLLTWLIKPLSLQPFNPEHFKAGSDYSSFDALWFKVAQNQQQEASNSQKFINQPLSLPQGFSTQKVALDDLYSAHKNSAQFFLKRRLNIPPKFAENEISESEPFSLTGLDMYKLKDAYFEQKKDSGLDSGDDFLQRHQALGALPVYESGKLVQADIQADANLRIEFYKQHIQNKKETPWHGSIEIKKQDTSLSTHIQASISNIYDDEVISMRAGRIKGDTILNAWLQLCVLVVADHSKLRAVPIKQARLVGVNKGELLQVCLSAPSLELAYEQLHLALDFYWECWQSPPLYFPNTLWPVLNADDEIKQWKTELESEFSLWNNFAVQRVLPEQTHAFLSAPYEDKLALISPHNLLEKAFQHRVEES